MRTLLDDGMVGKIFLISSKGLRGLKLTLLFPPDNFQVHAIFRSKIRKC
jgi:hypothetical protein